MIDATFATANTSNAKRSWIESKRRNGQWPATNLKEKQPEE
jgi:hypothetical protein